MGFFSSLFRRDQRAMPDPGSAEFQQAVEASALPGSAQMGDDGWISAAQQPAGGSGAAAPAGGMPMADQLIAAGVPADQAQQTAAALAQLQQAFGGAGFGGAMASADVSVSTGPSQTLDLRGMEGLRDEMKATMRQYGVDPDSGQAFDASQVPGLQDALLAVLAKHGVDASGF